MKNQIAEYFKNALAITLDLENYSTKKLPLFINEENDIFLGEVLGVGIIFMIPKRKININIINKRIRTIRSYTDLEICVVFADISNYQRTKMIEKHIPFIFINRQIYLPFIAMEYNNIHSNISISKISMFSPSAQLIYLYLLYNNKYIAANELAGIINRSEMTVSRALKELISMNLLICETEGKTRRKKRYRPVDFKQYYEEGYTCLKNPILKVIHLNDVEVYENMVLAGETALSGISMMSSSSTKSFAIFKDYIKEINTHHENNDDNLIRLEVWSYDPKILMKNDHVDIISLKLTLEQENDERINFEIEEIIRESEWYVE